jgi:DnaK suppressor protein
MPTQAKTRKASAAAKKAKSSANFTNFKPYQPKPREAYMNDAQKRHFCDILSAWKAELMEEVDRTVSHMKDEAANFPDPADRATQDVEFSL